MGVVSGAAISPVSEKHYRVSDLVELWRLSRNVITRLFQYEPGVLKFGSGRYVTLSIPESVALRVHLTLGQEPLKTKLAGSNPASVVYLRDAHTGVVQKPRHVLKIHAGKQTTNRKRIA